MSFLTRCGETIDHFFQSIAIVKNIFKVKIEETTFLCRRSFERREFYGDQTAQESLSFNGFYDRRFKILVRFSLSKEKTNWEIP